MRKAGRFDPGPKVRIVTALSWRGREETLEVQRASLGPRDRVILVDDWAETGSQALGREGADRDMRRGVSRYVVARRPTRGRRSRAARARARCGKRRGAPPRIRHDPRVSLSQHEPIVRELFDRTLAAQRAWVKGDASGYIDLFSPDQLTIFGPFGGPAVEGRSPDAATRVAGLFSDGVCDIDLVDAMVSDDTVCLVMVERCEALFAGLEGRRRWVLRTTQIYCRSGDVWHVVHRHADPLIDPRTMVETLDLLCE